MTILALLAGAALFLWCYLVVGHGWFWRTDVRLPPVQPVKEWPAVGVVVPARDEAAMLPITLPTLLSQDYPGAIHVVLVDDRSADGTAEAACRAAAGADQRLTIVAGTRPPIGWTGKLWALQQGLAALQPVPPELVLFTDADIFHPPDSLRRLVALGQREWLDMVSLMALLPSRGRWERLLIPAFVYFFAQLYPFRRVNTPGGRTAAAAGGCELIRLAALERAGGLEHIRSSVIDDVALAGLIKRAGGRIWLGLSSEVRSCRPYPQLDAVWGMVARSAFTQLRYSYGLLAITVAGLALTYLVPPGAAIAGAVSLTAGGGTSPVVALGSGVAAWALMAATYIPMLRHHGRHALESLLLPIAAALYLLMMVDSAWQHLRRGGAEWKGRRYAASTPPPVNGRKD